MRKADSSPPVEPSKSASAGVVILTLICLAAIWYLNTKTPRQQARVIDQIGTADSPSRTARDSSTDKTRDSHQFVHENEPFLPQFASDEHNDSRTISARISRPGSTERTSKNPVLIHDQTIRDLSGHIVFKGTIDLGLTLDRIEAGTQSRHRKDGTTFQNREGRLPRKAAGYYREYVHPTPGENGPGPQRIILGKDGDIWYTPDHYKTFTKVDGRTQKAE